MLCSMLTRILLAGLAFVSSSQAWAYPTTGGNVIWPFEAHGSDVFGGPTYTFSGELALAPFSIGLSATIAGSPLSGYASPALIDSAPGVGSDSLQGGGPNGLSQILTPSPGVLRPMDLLWGPGLFELLLIDLDGTAFDGPTLPDYAPDVDVFETHSIVIWQDHCIDYDPGDTYCSTGGGLHVPTQVFTIT